VIANLIHGSGHPVALEFLLRLAAAALVTIVILGLLPAIVEAAQ
jgi:zinc transporter ZupT